MGRSIYCSKCKREKEDAVKNESYCKACKSERMKQAAIKKRISLGLPPTRPVRDALCEGCIAKKEIGGDIRGRCPECHRMDQAKRVKANRMANGLPPESSRSTVLCIKCNEPKVNGRCMPCNNKVKNAAKSAKRQKLREKQGKIPWGSGRRINCYLCNEVKENRDAAYCNKCSREQSKKRWKEVIAPKINQKPITLICECGKEKESTQKQYCNDCLIVKRKFSNSKTQRRIRNIIKNNGFVPQRKVLTDEEKTRRKAARDYHNLMIKKGLVKRQNCEICSSDINVEAHHDDYARPLDVRWLCRVHHDEHHINERNKD